MSRPDLSWIREAVGLGAVIDAVISRIHSDRGLVELTFDGGTLVAPAHEARPGAAVRVRIPAREIILATSAPQALSLHNVLTGTVSEVHANPDIDQVVVQIAVGRIKLLAEVTRDAVARLRIGVGMPIYALIKSVSIELVVPGTVAETDRQ
jgi:molybdate transport system ATP-binding protein